MSARWPTTWNGSRAPRFPVTMVTTRDETGVDYEVRVCDGNPSAFEEGESDTGVWSTRRDFGQQTATLAGGAAFQYAAREQQRIADEWAKAIEKATERAP